MCELQAGELADFGSFSNFECEPMGEKDKERGREIERESNYMNEAQRVEVLQLSNVKRVVKNSITQSLHSERFTRRHIHTPKTIPPTSIPIT